MNSLLVQSKSVMKTHHQVLSELQTIARKYPPELQKDQLQDVWRISYHIEMVARRKGTACRLCDLGGGIGLFSIGCAALGMDAVLVDDFRDSIAQKSAENVLDLHRSYGVQIVNRDVIHSGLDFLADSFDVISTFDSMEHWHHSPKRLFASVVQSLKPGGLFVIGTPNSVNLRKRLTVPLGVSCWSRMADWYEAEEFRGHVREPSVADLKYIAQDMGLVEVEILGRNWSGYASRSRLVRLSTIFADRLLTLFPSLCSNIYMVGTKPIEAGSRSRFPTYQACQEGLQ